MPRKLAPRSVEKLIAKMTTALERGKAGYAAADEAEGQLIAAAQAAGGTLPRTGDRPPLKLKDNFLDSSGQPRTRPGSPAA